MTTHTRPPTHHPPRPTPQAAADQGYVVLSLEELMAKGAAAPVEPVAPSPDDLCTIMYTSGGWVEVGRVGSYS